VKVKCLTESKTTLYDLGCVLSIVNVTFPLCNAEIVQSM